jgi:hypothetical protein
MTDEQLRIRAAELMGWTEVEIEDGIPIGVHPMWSGQLPPGETTKGDLPDYPNDIAAAWELVDYMGFKKGLDIELCGGPLVWEASFAPVDGEAIGFSRDSTAPKAITLAFIAAMEGE